MNGRVCALAILLLTFVSSGLSRPHGIPGEPAHAIPAGYEWVPQQTAEGNILWVPREVEAAEQHLTAPPPPQYNPPLGWWWVPKYNGMEFIAWVMEVMPSFWELNEALIKYIGGIFLAILNVFSFRWGHSNGMTTVQKTDTSAVRSRP